MGGSWLGAARDAAHWPDYEFTVFNDDLARLLLDTCGAGLAQAWLTSLNEVLSTQAKQWIERHWEENWDALADPARLWLVRSLASRLAVVSGELAGFRRAVNGIGSILGGASPGTAAK